MKTTNLQELIKIAEKQNQEFSQYKKMLMVCTGTGCVSAKGMLLKDALIDFISENKLENDYLVVGTGCNGFCAVGPIVVIQPEGTFYQKVEIKDIPEIMESLTSGNIIQRLLYRNPVTGNRCATMEEIPFFSKQQLIALRNKGLIDPENINHYISRGGYQPARKLIDSNNPEGIIQELIDSGLRGRGGGGFPAGVKWKSGKEASFSTEGEIYLICNADEGDPGAFMDRSIIETDPHSVIEGMIIGSIATGAKEGYVYIRKEYPLACERLEIAIAQAREFGFLGNNIFGTDQSFDLHIHRGAGAFVCGESSALMQSMQGKVGEPRSKYVRSVEQGFRDKPSILNNVETWANIPVIFEKGAEWFASIGTGNVKNNPWGGSTGTKVFSLVGNVNNTGLVEVPMGITLREIIEEIGGGIPDKRKFKAVQTGGPSGGCIPESLLDMKVDFDSLNEAGSMMGSGGMIVMDEKTCMVDVARYFTDFLSDESCGKCTSCREGLFTMKNILTRICEGNGKMEDIDLLAELADTMTETSLCQLGATGGNPVLSTLKYFKDEYIQHIEHQKCVGGICKSLIQYSINTGCVGCRACAKNCPVDAIQGTSRSVHKIITDKCIKCGICMESCKFDAVEVE